LRSARYPFNTFFPTEIKSHTQKIFTTAGRVNSRVKLKAKGINNISGSEFCAIKQSQQYFSSLRDDKTCRIASVVSLLNAPLPAVARLGRESRSARDNDPTGGYVKPRQVGKYCSKRIELKQRAQCQLS